MMRFTAFPEVQLNPGMRDIGDRQWTKPIHRAIITHSKHMSLDISPITPVAPIPLVPGLNRVSKKAVKRI
jgi:hypothetical protein